MPTAPITELDTYAGVDVTRYDYTRVVRIAGHTVRARIERERYHNESLAVAELLNNQGTWTRLAEDIPGNWWHGTRAPRPHVDPAAVLAPVADRLLQRAATILAPDPSVLSPHVLDAVSALLATTYGYHGERRIDPDEIVWATTHGGRLHIIEHADGGVTFTKQHRDECPAITSAGTRECDDECDFLHPAEVTGRRT